jgi:hypothetical protein
VTFEAIGALTLVSEIDRELEQLALEGARGAGAAADPAPNATGAV